MSEGVRDITDEVDDSLVEEAFDSEAYEKLSGVLEVDDYTDVQVVSRGKEDEGCVVRFLYEGDTVQKEVNVTLDGSENVIFGIASREVISPDGSTVESAKLWKYVEGESSMFRDDTGSEVDIGDE